MNTAHLTCPNCRTALRPLATPAPGARCTCPKCGTTFAIGAPAAAPAGPPARAEKVPPAIQSAPPNKAARPLPDRAAPKVSPAPQKPKKSLVTPLVLLLGGVAVGGVLLVLLAGTVGLAAWGWSRSKSPRPAPGPHAALLDTSRQAQTPADPPKDPAKEDPPKDPVIKPADPGDGSLPAEVLNRVKHATLYIKVQTSDGREATGSGFFEESSGMVITNAHVVGMLRPGAPPPRRIDVVLNSGNAQVEATLPAKLVAVDRTSDLAILDVPLPPPQANVQPKLAVLAAKEMQETQRVYVVGFPFGEKVNRNVTVSTTSISSMHRGKDGVVTKVQVNGGMHPGNSGGPVIDPRGHVIGVAVSGIEGTQINFAIPGESVNSLLEGRVSEIVVTTDVIARDGKLVVPVELRTIDPRKRITRLAMDYWTGPARPNPVPPGDKPPSQGAVDSPRKTVELAYDAARGVGKAELPLDVLPEANKRLWLQPVVTNGAGKTAWLSGNAYTLSAPLEEKPAVLQAQYRVGAAPVHLTSTLRVKLEREGKELSVYQNLDARLNEQTVMAGPAGARVRLGIQKLGTGVSVNNEPVPTDATYRKALQQDVGALALDFQLDAQGNLTSKKTDLSRVPPASREILDSVGEQLQKSFDLVAIPQPGGEAQPGRVWQARRELLIDMPGGKQTALVDMTYTFRGVRQHKGRLVAVVALHGRFSGSRAGTTLAGQTTGTALIDPETGVVLQAKALSDATLRLRNRTETFQASGTLEVRLHRGPDVE